MAPHQRLAAAPRRLSGHLIVIVSVTGLPRRVTSTTSFDASRIFV
jgi:hypothetical protein